ncbi:hypothetical protein CsSME_00002639 [Camellia sinensis var. sinensis]|uniref:Uncharacterized protein n=1 Tax=Camellia sinensis var. sinensis TaxID=542762 RepID=A0A4S4EAI9_CAMSN|nr:uncharacterized protein LOC114287246 isoform X1 [Camellia sinensis]THG12714.1 hypothetical protein TEA_026841 [Camellia sinensis var. sinensis]
MSLTPQTLLGISNSRISFYFTNTTITSLQTPNFSLSFSSKHFSNLPRFRILTTKPPNPSNFKSFNTHHWPLRAFELNGTVQKSDSADSVNFDAFLSVVEFLCLASSVVISIGFALNSAISSSQKPIIAWLGNRVFVWQSVLLVAALVIGSLIRRRQWRRLCADVSRSGVPGINLIERIEKLEEDLRSSTTIIRVLSRQLEKLGIRFRVTRKNLKEPLAEAAALAQKNSEATRALAVQEDNLEKELSEIQKVLLAMQEQQQKQLELILAIGKTGKVWDTKRRPSQDQEAIEKSKGTKQMATPKIQALTVKKESENDRA